MAELDVASAVKSDMTGRVDDITVDTISTDGASEQLETEWTNENWTQYYGYYRTIPEVKTAIDMRAIWTVGKGFKADAGVQAILNNVNGWGTDTFDSILKNMITVRRIGGDSFAEIVRNDKGFLVNIKPLDPGSIKIVVNRQGILKRYEQISKHKTPSKKFKPDEIFHLMNKRVADEIHGVSDIEAIEEIIKANNESFFDMKKLQHRFVKPMMKFTLDTDDTTKIDALVRKFDEAVNKGENMYIPKGTVEQDLIAVPSNATLNPLPWRDHLKNYFFQVVGIPQIILGSSGEFTESTAKIAYLAFQQSVEDEQRDIITQVWEQLALRIELVFPASLENELLSDSKKDGGQQTQPNETIAGRGE